MGKKTKKSVKKVRPRKLTGLPLHKGPKDVLILFAKNKYGDAEIPFGKGTKIKTKTAQALEKKKLVELSFIDNGDGTTSNLCALTEKGVKYAKKIMSDIRLYRKRRANRRDIYKKIKSAGVVGISMKKLITPQNDNIALSKTLRSMMKFGIVTMGRKGNNRIYTAVPNADKGVLPAKSAKNCPFCMTYMDKLNISFLREGEAFTEIVCNFCDNTFYSDKVPDSYK